MSSFYLSPFASFLQLFSESGIPLNGGLIWTYLAGSSASGPTYTDSTGVFQNANPIVLGSDGRLQNVSIWQQGGVVLKYVFSTNAGTSGSPVFGTQLGPTFDQISGINDPSGSDITGFFTATGVGFSGTAPTFPCVYIIQGSFVSVIIGQGFGTSNSTSFALSGIPAAIIPPTQEQNLPIWYAQNNSSTATSPFISIGAGVTTWNLGNAASFTGWTGSGTKGLEAAVGITYALL